MCSTMRPTSVAVGNLVLLLATAAPTYTYPFVLSGEIRKTSRSTTIIASPGQNLSSAFLLRGGESSLQDETAVEIHTEEEEEVVHIKDALLQNVLFSSLPEPSLLALVGAFEKISVSEGEVIVKQGDVSEGDYVYLIADGFCRVSVDGKILTPPYGMLRPNSVFGELGVLYNRPRAATITAQSKKVVLFRIKAEVFKGILNKPSEYLEAMEEVDEAINQISGSKALYGGQLIPQYKPGRLWLWKRVSGTVLQHSLKPTLFNMLLSVCVITAVRYAEPTWVIGLVPDAKHPIVQRLSLMRKIWGYQQPLTTFILTFFVNHAFGFWNDVLSLARSIQGRLNDFFLLLATNADRKKDGTMTEEAIRLMEDVGQYSRLFHALMWSSFARRFAVLRTPAGLDRMASRGIITSKQLEVLQALDIPSNQKHSAPLEWMMIRTNQAIEKGIIKGHPASTQELLSRHILIRAKYGAISDKLAARMPMAYTHFVQVLVDTFVLTSPFALYPDLGAWSVIAVGIITLFYTGLLDLAKIFLDPFNNENFCRNSIFMDVGVLIRESNAGSTRWLNSGLQLPF